MKQHNELKQMSQGSIYSIHAFQEYRQTFLSLTTEGGNPSGSHFSKLFLVSFWKLIILLTMLSIFFLSVLGDYFL
jgi:hypothetical protein